MDSAKSYKVIKLIIFMDNLISLFQNYTQLVLTYILQIFFVQKKSSCLFLFDLILYVPSTIFQLCRDRSSWVKPVLS